MRARTYLVITIPNGVSIGNATPTKLVATSGRKQNPSTLADLAIVSVLDKFPGAPPPPPPLAPAGSGYEELEG